MKFPRPTRTHGFSILELAVVLVIIAFVVGTSLIAGDMQIQASKVMGNRNTLTAARDALELFKKKNKRYPCPAGGSIAENATGYGLEQTGCLTSCAASLICPAASTAIPPATVAIGSLPFKTLGLPSEASYDQQGNRLTYAVERKHTLVSKNAIGTLPINDAADNLITASPLLGKAIYVVIGPGDNKNGAWQRNGTRTTCVSTAPVPLDSENCNDDSVFRDVAFNKSKDATKYFDDTMMWTTQRLVPPPVIIALPSWAYVSATSIAGGYGGNATQAVISKTSRLFSMGTDASGTLGLGVANGTIVGTATEITANVASFKDWIAIDGGGWGKCALRQGGDIWCWGDNFGGSMSNGTTGAPSNVPVKAGISGVSQFSASGSHVCAIKAGEIWCWGFNGQGTLGDGTQTDSPVPHKISGSFTDWKLVNTAYHQTCAIRGSSNLLYCWGADYGVFGNTSAVSAPVLTPTLAANGMTGWRMVSLMATANHSGIYAACGIRDESGLGALYCWGQNNSPEFPLAQGVYATPTFVDSSRNWKTVMLAGAYAGGTAIDGGGKLWSWGFPEDMGNPAYGTSRNQQVGGGPMHMIPDDVPFSDFTNIGGRADTQTHCAVRVNRDLYCWGRNHSKQIGTAYADPLTKPTLLAPIN